MFYFYIAKTFLYFLHFPTKLEPKTAKATKAAMVAKLAIIAILAI